MFSKCFKTLAIAFAISFIVLTTAKAQTQQSASVEEHYLKVKFAVELYGYLKLDMAYDTARLSVGDFARWVESEATNEDDDQFNITVNQSRFGLKFAGPDSPTLKTTGLVEIDFYGGGAENKPNPMLRHGYLQLTWPEKGLSLLAGQTSDVISPLTPATINYAVAWWAGNIGYRRPQLRLTGEWGDPTKIIFQVALSRTIGDATTFSPGDTGEDAGYPTVQSRLALSFPISDKKATIGVSGHWGMEEYDYNNKGDNEDFRSWSLNAEANIPIMPWLAFQGEFFYGENLDDYFGGIGQGVNLTTLEEIQAMGGWATLNFGPFGAWRFVLGGNVDDPDDDDLSNGGRSLNVTWWGNVTYDINKAVQVGLELAYWLTEYKGGEDSDSFRAQTAFIYKF